MGFLQVSVWGGGGGRRIMKKYQLKLIPNRILFLWVLIHPETSRNVITLTCFANVSAGSLASVSASIQL